MRLPRLLAAAGGLTTALVLTGSSSGAFFDVPLTPGHFSSTNQFAFAGMFDSSGNQLSVAFQFGRLQFRPKGGGPLIPVNGTMVSASLNTPDGVSGFGCWLATGDAITVNSDLSATASFDSTSSSVSLCPGMLVTEPLTAAAPHLPNLDQGQGLTGPVTFSVQWSPSAPVDVIHSVINGTCQTWTSVEQITASNVFATGQGSASMTVSGVNFNGNAETVTINGSFGTSNGFAQVSTEQDSEVVNGPSSGNCGPYGS